MHWDPKMRDNTLLSKQRVENDLPKLREHGEEVRQAREAQRETGYKVRWHIGWGALVGWLILAALVGVVVYFLFF
jgi:hypothetical protein